jgi:hypothetical protein
VEKGGTVTYETPQLDVIGKASDLIQGSIGTNPDTDGTLVAHPMVATMLEE